MSDNWKDRVKVELEELEEKLKKLDAFMDTEAFFALSMRHRELMHHQVYYMVHYKEILKKRMEQ